MTTTRDATAGHNTVVAFEFEDTFGTLPGTPTWKNLGIDATVNTKEVTHNLTKLFDPDSREATESVTGLVEGTLSVEFVMSNPDFLEFVIAPGDDASPETYDGFFPTSGTFVVGDENKDEEDILKGCVLDSAEITSDTPGEVRASLEFTYAEQETDTVEVGNTSGISGQPTPSNPPLKSGDTSSKLTVGGTTVEIISAATLSISNNVDMLPEFGTNTAADYSPKERAVDVSYSKVSHVNEAVDEKSDLYGGGSTTKDNDPNEDNVVIDFDNGTEGIEFQLGPGVAADLADEGLGDVDADVELSPDRTVLRDRGASTPAVKAVATGY